MKYLLLLLLTTFSFSNEFISYKGIFLNSPTQLAIHGCWDNVIKDFDEMNIAIVEIDDIYTESTHYFIDRKGEIIPFNKINGINYKFDVNTFKTDNAQVAEHNALWGYYHRNGGENLEFKYDNAYNFEYNGLAIVREKNYGIINSKGEYIVPPIYDDIEFFSNKEITTAKKDGKYGVINTKGEIVIPFYYDTIEIDEITHTIIVQLEKYSLFDFNGEPLFDNTYKNLKKQRNNLFAYQDDNDRWGFLDIYENVIIEPHFDDVLSFENSMNTGAMINGKWGFINKNGEWIIKPQFTEVNNFKNGFAAFRNHNLWGFINENGEIIIPAKFDEIYSFNENNIAMVRDTYWGVIDTKGNYILQPSYLMMEETVFGHIIVQNQNHQWLGLMDNNGTLSKKSLIAMKENYIGCQEFLMEVENLEEKN